MEINPNDGEARKIVDEQKVPFLQERYLTDTVQRNTIQQAISKSFQSMAHLANLLPTGTVLAFQLLAPIVTNVGQCDDVNQVMTYVLIALCGSSSFLLSFTDSFKDMDGNVSYGFATFYSLRVMDCSVVVPPSMAAKYRLHLMDFVHAFMTVLVFAAIALFDKNTVQCFYPMPSRDTQELLTVLPVAIGVICSTFFVMFPTDRHGIGFPCSTSSSHDRQVVSHGSSLGCFVSPHTNAGHKTPLERNV